MVSSSSLRACCGGPPTVLHCCDLSGGKMACRNELFLRAMAVFFLFVLRFKSLHRLVQGFVLTVIAFKCAKFGVALCNPVLSQFG